MFPYLLQIRILIVVVVCFSFSSISAQEIQGKCGTGSSEEIVRRLIDNKDRLSAGLLSKRSAPPYYVPVKFHLVGRNDGSGRIQEKDVFEQLCQLNQLYGNFGMEFYLRDDGINYINNTAAFQDPGSQGNLLAIFRDNSSLNIYIVESATSGGGPGVTLAYYDPVRDWIVTRKDMVELLIPNVVPHEVGHYFSLLHPFNGWDQVPHDVNLHGNPVNMTTAPDGQTPVELVSRTNCESAGDYICDTDADYNLGFGWDGCTPYDGGVRDRNGQLLNPDEDNVMGYFFTCPSYSFTTTQTELIISDYLSPQRGPIRDDGFVPEEGPITGNPSLISPPNFSTTEYFDEVVLEWEPTPGANRYYIEVAINSAFTSKIFNGISRDPLFVLTDLEPNTDYYWRVKPLNDLNYCKPYSVNRSFSTPENSVGTNEIPELAGWTVAPNPVAHAAFLSIEIRSTRSLKAGLELLETSGKRIWKKDVEINSGPVNMNIPTAGLSPGVYWLRLSSARGTASKKVLVY